MKKKNLSLVLFLAVLLVREPVSAQITFGTRTLINRDWRFRLDSLGDFSQTAVDDSAWRRLDLPHDWSIESATSPQLASCTGYLPGGVGWYRKTVAIPHSEQGLRQYLYFGGIYCNSRVWVNGQLVGERPNGYVSLMYDITPYVQVGAENSIAVRVDHSKSADSRWYTGSGIYRDVYRVTAAPIHIAHWGLFARTARVTDDGAEIAVTAKLRNHTSREATVQVIHRLYPRRPGPLAACGRQSVTIPAHGTASVTMPLDVANPHLWSVDAPNLYRLETSVVRDGAKIDAATTVTGIRQTRFDPDEGFFLNGENLKLKGVCLHHDAGALGAAVPRAVWERRLLALKRIGCNAVRMSHNPQAEELYDLCDELGLMVLDEAFDEWEFPKRKWIEGWNVGKNPGYQGYADYFEAWAERDLADMVLRDRNHPSVIMWSIGNEVDYPNDPYSHPILDTEGINQKSVPGYKPDRPRAERIGEIAKRLVRVVEAIDTSRVVTGAMAGVVMSNQTDYPSVLDVTGYNYTENRYLSDHAAYPRRIIYGSENRHEYPHWLAVRDNEHICGQFLWTGIDYLGEAGRYPSRGFFSGLLDLGGFIKPRGYYRQSLWSDEPMVYIGAADRKRLGKKTLLFDLEPAWNHTPGDTVRVAAFTNCEEVVLTLNGRRIEAEPHRDKASNALWWDIPFSPGTLEASAFVRGELRAVRSVRTYGPAVRLSAVPDVQRVPRGGLVHVELQVVDADGVRVLDASPRIACKVSGAGRLLRMENADPRYTGSFLGDTLPACKGRLLAYIVAAEESGRIEVSFTAAGLRPVSLKIGVESER